MVESTEKKQAKQNRLGAKRQHGLWTDFFCSGLKIKKQVEKQSGKWLKSRRKSKRSKTVLEQSDNTVFAKCFFVADSTLLRENFFRENFLEDFF